MNSRDCPRFESCSAPLCPLDKTAGSHLPGEPVCRWLREIVKEGGVARLRQTLPGEMVDQIAEALPGILSGHGYIKRRLDRASRSASKATGLKNKTPVAAGAEINPLRSEINGGVDIGTQRL